MLTMRVVAKSFEKDLDQIILKDKKLALVCDGKELKLQYQNVATVDNDLHLYWG